MKTERTKLEKLVDMANEKPLKQKPSRILGKKAEEFIRLFAKRHVASAFFSGLRLKDEGLIKESMLQLLEQSKEEYCGADSETIFEAYKYQRVNRVLDNNQEYELRHLVLARSPKRIYLFDLEESLKRSKDYIQKRIRTNDLRESREYFALKEPDEAFSVSRERINFSGKRYIDGDDDLRALAKPNLLAQALLKPDYFGELGNMSKHDYELGMMTARAAIKLLKEDKGRETSNLKTREKQMTARAAYLGARYNRDYGLRRTSTEYYIEYNLDDAERTALDPRWNDPELGRLIVAGFLEQNAKTSVNNAYEICQKYKLEEQIDKVRVKFVATDPKPALNCGLEYKDKKLIELARKKLGKRIDKTEIELFGEQ